MSWRDTEFDKKDETISDEEMDDLRRRAIRANPEKARFDTSKAAAEERHENNRRLANRRFN